MKTHLPVDLPEIISEDTATGRWYQTPGGRFPSVTTVLKPHAIEGIGAWRKAVGDEEADRVMRRASMYGNEFHAQAETYLRNLPVLIPDLHQRSIFKAGQTMLDRIDNIYALEAGLYSTHLRMAGRVDCVAEFDGKLSIIDFKTANDIKHESMIEHYFMQAAAYAIMWEEQTGQPINALRILMVSRACESKVFMKKRDDFVRPLLQYRNLFESSSCLTQALP